MNLSLMLNGMRWIDKANSSSCMGESLGKTQGKLMSVLYGTLQAHSDYTSEAIMSLLAEEGVTPPSGFKPGRYPTPNEMRNALKSLNNPKITYYVNSDS